MRFILSSSPSISPKTGDAEPSTSACVVRVGILSGVGGRQYDNDSGVLIHSSEVERSHSSLNLVGLGKGHHSGSSPTDSRIGPVLRIPGSGAGVAQYRRDAEGGGNRRRLGQLRQDKVRTGAGA